MYCLDRYQKHIFILWTLKINETAAFIPSRILHVSTALERASIGLDRYYFLVEGGKEAHGLDDLVLEVKEVRTPIPAYFLPYRELFWERYEHQGERVISTQKAMASS